MAIITDKSDVMAIGRKYKNRQIPVCVFGTGNFWNTEAILLAAKNFKEKHSLKEPVAVTMAITYDYAHMSQCARFSYNGNLQAGLESNFHYLHELCGRPGSPYYDVIVLPHLDHANPEKDKWALTEGVHHFASVMFDAQTYSLEENLRLTAEYVEKYGDRVVIEGILDELPVFESAGHPEDKSGRNTDEDYARNVIRYVDSTGVDFVVADLGTEQQSNKVGDVKYLKNRARLLSKLLKDKGIVLHGTSSMSDVQLAQLGDDGIARVNMWTRIARESGEAAATKLLMRTPLIRQGDFEATESRQYIYDSITSAADIMENMMEILGYKKLLD